MKFELYYNDKLEKYKHIKNKLFDYSIIKKYIKDNNNNFLINWKKILEKELDKTDNILFPNFFSKYIHKYYGLTSSDILFLSELCTIAFNKICKKIKKYNNIDTFNYKNKIKSDCIYNFLGSGRKTFLTQLTNECPICLEDTTTKLILRCGHYLCDICANKIYNKTITNFSIDSNFNPPCPECRAVIPYVPGMSYWKNTEIG